eukprot:365852-Chlamydomonas_euryale.AAC.13
MSPTYPAYSGSRRREGAVRERKCTPKNERRGELRRAVRPSAGGCRRLSLGFKIPRQCVVVHAPETTHGVLTSPHHSHAELDVQLASTCLPRPCGLWGRQTESLCGSSEMSRRDASALLRGGSRLWAPRTTPGGRGEGGKGRRAGASERVWHGLVVSIGFCIGCSSPHGAWHAAAASALAASPPSRGCDGDASSGMRARARLGRPCRVEAAFDRNCSPGPGTAHTKNRVAEPFGSARARTFLVAWSPPRHRTHVCAPGTAPTDPLSPLRASHMRLSLRSVRAGAPPAVRHAACSVHDAAAAPASGRHADRAPTMACAKPGEPMQQVQAHSADSPETAPPVGGCVGRRRSMLLAAAAAALPMAAAVAPANAG